MANVATLTSPASGAAVKATSGSASVAFAWATDFQQTSYQLRYRLTSASTWTTVSDSSGDKTKTVTLSEGEYIWQVKSIGPLTPGDWSDTSTFGVYDAPTVGVTTPANNSTVTSWPLQYTLSFADDNGTFAGGWLALLDASDMHTVYRRDDVTELTGEITTDDYMPVNGSYVLTFQARSSTTLESYGSSNITINIASTDKGTLAISNSAATGYATLTVGWDNTGGVHASSASVYRINGDGTRTLLGDGLAQNATVVDKFAPLNTAYTYQVVTHAEPTAVSSKDFTNTIKTDRWFVIWNGGADAAWAIWNPSGSYELKRPQKKRVHYVGRE